MTVIVIAKKWIEEWCVAGRWSNCATYKREHPEVFAEYDSLQCVPKMLRYRAHFIMELPSGKIIKDRNPKFAAQMESSK